MNIGGIFRKKSSELFSVEPAQPLTEAVALMARQRIGSLMVMEQNQLISIVTERDVLCAVERHGEQFSRVRVRDVMASRLVTCSATTSIDDAMELMLCNPSGHRIRHLPVLEGDTLLGIISMSDLVQALLTETRFENKMLRNYINNWPED